jgi:hypothetical protein
MATPIQEASGTGQVVEGLVRSSQGSLLRTHVCFGSFLTFRTRDELVQWHPTIGNAQPILTLRGVAPRSVVDLAFIDLRAGMLLNLLRWAAIQPATGTICAV